MQRRSQLGAAAGGQGCNVARWLEHAGAQALLSHMQNDAGQHVMLCYKPVQASCFTCSCGAGLYPVCQTVVTMVLLIHLALQRLGTLRFGAAAPCGSRLQTRAMSLLQRSLQVHSGTAEHLGRLHATKSLSEVMALSGQGDEGHMSSGCQRHQDVCLA